MLRGARIDLEASLKATQALQEVYVRDLESRELSDDAIAAVNTIVRSLEGALGKIAHEVGKRFVAKTVNPYFPITDCPSKFPTLLQKQLPGLAANHPDIAAAFERQQPYQPGHEPVGLLKELYRENHHHDFTLQERRETQSNELRVGGGVLFSMGAHGFSLGGPPPWRGIPVSQTQNPPAETPAEHPPDGLMQMSYVQQEDGTTEVYINGKLMPQTSDGIEAVTTDWIDWYFTQPEVSVLGTLIPLHDLCVMACEEIWASTGL